MSRRGGGGGGVGEADIEEEVRTILESYHDPSQQNRKSHKVALIEWQTSLFSKSDLFQEYETAT